MKTVTGEGVIEYGYPQINRFIGLQRDNTSMLGRQFIYGMYF
jgi:hypothetical protein